jgi:hypothetical protein
MKPPTSLLESMSESKPKPQAEITVTVESEPDYETLWSAFDGAKGAKAKCQALAAICECCGGMEDAED